MDAKTRALRVIRDEHATLTAVMQALCIVTDGMAKGTLPADFKLLWSIIYYIEEYPELLHHPKEEQLLFPAVRRRTSALDETLAELGRQHGASLPHLNHIKTMLGRVEAQVPGALQQLAQLVERYSAFHWQHMRTEEDQVLSAAADVLVAADWEDIARGFDANIDLVQQGHAHDSQWFRSLFQRIVYLVPPPWGLGGT
jgi:hemerythrin-like domain-containing protein